MRLDDWFLTADERGNPASHIDRRHASAASWTENNEVNFLIDGARYFSRLASAFEFLQRGDQVFFTDWRTDSDELMGPNGHTVGDMIARACEKGVDVRGLLWRSHTDRLAFSAKENRRFAAKVASAGGEVLLDERVRRGGSHHQKLFLIRQPLRPQLDVAFVGGIDLSHGRCDDARHHGDGRVIKLDHRYGSRPAWHDVQIEVHGPAIKDLELTFRERWDDPSALNHSGPLRAWSSRKFSLDRVTKQLPAPLEDPSPCGTKAIQVLRTYPVRRPRYPFAPQGERSVALGFQKAIERARSLIYIEDQYFWSQHIAELLARALRRHPQLQLIVVVPRFPDKDGRLSGPPSRLAQQRAMDIVRAAGGSRVGVYSLNNDLGAPVYVHAKVCVIDDVWATVGSDNLNRRSWTHDSELSCAIIDSEFDERVPMDPGGLGDRSRKFARELRMTLWAEHLGCSPEDPELLDIDHATEVWNRHAVTRSDEAPTHQGACMPLIQVHSVEAVSPKNRAWAGLIYRFVFDPDGRPLYHRLRRKY